MAETVLITGANRGLGLEFVRQFLKQYSPPRIIVATYLETNETTELLELSVTNPSVHPYKLDNTDFDALPHFAKKVEELVGEHGLDTLINNSGAYANVSLLEGSADDMLANFKLNAVSPLMITRALLPLLKKAASTTSTSSPPAVINISSKMGSIDDNTSGGHYAYRASKTALNAITKSMSVDLAESGIKTAAFHPGWVRTAMGGPNGLIDAVESVTNIIRVIGDVRTGKSNGLFVNYNGAEIKW